MEYKRADVSEAGVIVPQSDEGPWYSDVAKWIDYAAFRGFIIPEHCKNMLQKCRNNDLSTKPGDDPSQDEDLIVGPTGLAQQALEWLNKNIAPEGYCYLDHDGTLMLVTEEQSETYYSGTALI